MVALVAFAVVVGAAAVVAVVVVVVALHRPAVAVGGAVQHDRPALAAVGRSPGCPFQ